MCEARMSEGLMLAEPTNVQKHECPKDECPKDECCGATNVQKHECPKDEC